MRTPPLLCLLLLHPLALPASDWLQFRGPGSAAVAPAEAGPFPTALDPASSVAWKRPLPGRGLSSPIVIGNQVVVTCVSGPWDDQLHIFSFDATSGETQWERRFWASGRTMTHEKTSVAAATPCSDGERIFALFSSNDLFCLDLEGNLLWLRGLTFDYPNASNSLGMASSPVVVDGTLVVQSENDSESFAVGLDVADGTNRWKMDRPKAANWTSPVILQGDGPVVALQSSAGVTAVAPATGSELWTYDGGASTIPSSVPAGGILYVPSSGITALRPEAAGGPPAQLWRNAQIAPGTGSPLVLGDSIYSVSKAGVLAASRLADGERIWRGRVEGPFSGSPVGWDHYLCLVSETGIVQVVDLSVEEGATVARLELGETILCTPALAAGGIFVRSDAHLFKLIDAAAP